jgi:hypothetical protein
MLPNLFTEPVILIQGAITGLILGFLFQKGRLSYFNVIVGQLLLKDHTVLRVLLTAIIVGSIGIHGLLALGLPVSLHFKSITILAVVTGATIFGIGMAVLGYRTGGCIADAGQGSRSSWWGIFGMLFGALAYAELYGYIELYVIAKKSGYAATIYEALGISPWPIILVLTIMALILFKLLSKKQVQPEQATPEKPQPELPPSPQERSE